MGDLSVKVLYGDSTESTLEPDVLDLIVKLVICSREVATAVVEVENLELQRTEAVDATASIIADLDRFVSQAEFGLRATAKDMKRPELAGHGEEAVTAVKRLVEGWRTRYLHGHEAETSRIQTRVEQLQRDMLDAVGRFVLPLRRSAPERSVRRVLEGTRYRDQASVELVPGVRLSMGLDDAEPEQPRRIRTLVGKGARIQVGTKRSMLRRTEEPNHVAIDDLVILEAEVTQERARLCLAKKPAAKDRVVLELAAVGDGAHGVAALSSGERAALPDGDRPLLGALWQALQVEARRVIACPATLVGLALDDTQVEDAPSMLDCMARLVQNYRSVVRKIAERSPNPEELAIKIERGGKREEAWIRREELAQHYLAMPQEQRQRLTIAELDTGLDVAPGVSASAIPKVAEPNAGAQSQRIVLDPPPEESGAPILDLTEDISLQDIVVDGEQADEDGCVAPTRVRSRPT